jgi:hypothetical protein
VNFGFVKKQKKLLLVGIGLLILIIGQLLISGPLFEVRQIVISGNADIFANTSWLTKSRNLLYLSSANFEQDLKTHYPFVDKAFVTKRFPNTLELTVFERSPIAILSANTGFVFDATGVVLPLISRYSIGMYSRIYCPVSNLKIGKTVEDKSISLALYLISELRKSASVEITQVDCSEDRQLLTLKINQSQVLISPEQSQNYLASSLQFLLKQFRIDGKWPDTVDLRFDKPVLIP